MIAASDRRFATVLVLSVAITACTPDSAETPVATLASDAVPMTTSVPSDVRDPTTAEEREPAAPATQPPIEYPIVFEGHTAIVYRLVVLSDGRLASESTDGTVRVWDPDDPDADPIVFPASGERSSVLADGRIVTAVEGGVEVVDPTDPAVSPIAIPVPAVGLLDIAALDGGRLAIADQEGAIRVWDPSVPSEEPVEVADVLEGRITVLDDGRIVVHRDDGTLIILEPESSSQQVVLSGHTSLVREVWKLRDGRLVSSVDGGEVRIWDLPGLDDDAVVFAEHDGTVWGLSELDDGRVATASDDATIRVWDPDEPDLGSIVLVGHTSFLTEVLVLSDSRIASAGADATVRIWDLESPTSPELVLSGHTGWVIEIRELADGRIATASEDGTVRVWLLD